MDKVRQQRLVKAKSDALFLNLAEQVKTPFLQIAYAAEMLQAASTKISSEQLRQEIAVTTKSALQLIDGYLLSVELQRQSSLALESVSVSSILYDAASSLSDFAKANGCAIELQIDGKYGPAMGHRQAMLSALINLGYSLIEASTKLHDKDVPKVRLSVSRTAKGFRMGVFMNKPITKVMLTQAKALTGISHQPFAKIDSNNGSGILIAESLMSLVNAPLQTVRSRGYYGFAATFLPSRQLSLV
ncbi:MAG: hypothetical protein M3Q36_03545 [bacterium]|nr:hypothetical protein [bacterium]